MEDGIHRKPWSKTYKRSQVSYIERYFERYEVISADNLVDWYKTYFEVDLEKQGVVVARLVDLTKP